jgi:hypothetical protein
MNSIYVASLITYYINPFMASEDYVAETGNYSIDTTFPVYKPIIKDMSGNVISYPVGYSI